MADRSPVLIHNVATNTRFEAIFVDGVTLAEARTADAIWDAFKALLLEEARQIALPTQDLPEHDHWNWSRKAQRLAKDARHFGIEVGGLMQAMAIVLPSGHLTRHPTAPDLPLVYIDYIASAPWNYKEFLRKLGRQPYYSRVGHVLIAAAIQLSQALGYEGRIGLHSLPQTESFYAGVCGMLDLGPETFPYPGGEFELRYYEMTAAAARQFTGGGS